MNITGSSSLLGFLVALSTLNIPNVADASNQSSTVPRSTDASQTIEGRLSKLSEAIRQRESTLSGNSIKPGDVLVARHFRNGGAFRNGGFRNGGHGFVNGGGFRNF
jgi:rSAM-associated Gly-rich repeat protein